MLDNYVEETKPLFKMLRTEAFRFVIVRYNHFSFLKQLEEDLQRLFPDRPCLKVDAQKADYQSLTQTYFSISRGFLFIENFDDVLKEQFDSQNKETPQFAVENKRRRGITAGLNLRRDKLAQFPIALFVFVPASTGELYARIIMEKMPDLWSFRSFILDLEKEISVTNANGPARSLQTTDADPKTVLLQADTTELNRLLALLDSTPENETAYRLTLYPQIVKEAQNTGKYELAFSTLDTWENQVADPEKVWIWIQKGDIFTVYGQLAEALAIYQKAKKLAESNDEKHNIGLSNQRLGATYTALGDLSKALSLFEEYNALAQDLARRYPSNKEYKNNLAISYEKLGETHSSLGRLVKALEFFEQYNRLEKELYDEYPNHVDFKNGLAISYEKLGQTHSSLGSLEKALEFFEIETKLFEELYDEYPNNVAFKNGLAISYAKLGQTHSSLGNLEKALEFFEQSNKLGQER